jgi:hypothetical protein
MSGDFVTRTVMSKGVKTGDKMSGDMTGDKLSVDMSEIKMSGDDMT